MTTAWPAAAVDFQLTRRRITAFGVLGRRGEGGVHFSLHTELWSFPKGSLDQITRRPRVLIPHNRVRQRAKNVACREFIYRCVCAQSRGPL